MADVADLTTILANDADLVALTFGKLLHTGNIPLLGIPAGCVLHFAKNGIPTGFLKCNGAAISRTTYARLFTAIGTAFGIGDGTTTFTLPDLRGVFVRGFDDGRGLDPSRVFGAYQENGNLSHTHGAYTAGAGGHGHSINDSGHAHSIYGPVNQPIQHDSGLEFDTTINKDGYTTASSNNVTSISINGVGDHVHGVGVYADGGAESRPRNVALMACIRY